MASPGVSDADRDREFWPTLFRRQVAVNTRYWLGKISPSLETTLLRRERDNITKAVRWALALETAVEPALNLLLAFHPYMGRQGAMAEWQRFLEEGLRACQERGDAATEAALLDRLGELKRDQGEWATAAELHTEAYESSIRVGDQSASVRSQINLGYVYLLQRKNGQAREVLQQALEEAKACQDAGMEAYAYTTLGLLFYEQHDWKQSLASHRAADELWSELGNLEGMARTRHSMANTHRAAGNLDEAEAAFRSAMELYTQTDSRLYHAIVSMDMGNLFLRKGNPAQAEALYRRARDVMEQVRYIRGLAQVYNNLGMACREQGDRELAKDFYQRSIGLWKQLGEPVSQANTEDNLAEIYIDQGEWEVARTVLDRAKERLSEFEPEGRAGKVLSYIEEHLQAVEAAASKMP